MNIKWNTNPPSIDGDAILAQLDVNDETETYLCRIDDLGDLVDHQFGETYGWDYTCVDRWVLLSDIIVALNERGV